MGRLARIKNRIYSDYIMPSRIEEYEKIIKRLCDSGYEHISVKDYYKLLEKDALDGKKYFVNRHDIDTDVSTAKEFFRVEKKYNVKASYYFRLSTLDFKFMKEIDNYGSEASYHFEEIAQYCKNKHIKSKDGVMNNLDQIKELFSQNIKMIEKKTDIRIETLCSHGDFVNRKLTIVNHEITKDMKLREHLGIRCEAYDKQIMESFNIYLSDAPYPIHFRPQSIYEYIGKEKIICMLSHPRHWRHNFIVNSVDNFKRMYEGIKW